MTHFYFALSILIVCYFILSLRYFLEANIVLFTPVPFMFSLKCDFCVLFNNITDVLLNISITFQA